MKPLSMKRYVIKGSIDNVCCLIKELISDLQASYTTLEKNTTFELKVILSELLMNSIKHGNMGDQDKFIKVCSGVTKDGNVFFVIEDEGTGYDYMSVLEKNWTEAFNIDPCGMEESGRGLLIVRNLTDCVKFNSKGNKIIVLKSLNHL